jgi:hypothetical protein
MFTLLTLETVNELAANSNPLLQVLDLSAPPVHWNTVTCPMDEDERLFRGAMNTLDRRFDLGYYKTQALTEALKTNTTLKKLNLTNNQIGSEGPRLLEEALEVNYTLLELEGVVSTNITTYLNRNHRIAEGLELMPDANRQECK